MLRRCIWGLSSARSIGRRRGTITQQTPFFLSTRNEFSTASPKKSPQTHVPPPQGTSGSGSSISKLVLGGVVVGAGALAAYQSGYVDFGIKVPKDEQPRSSQVEDVTTSKLTEHSTDVATLPSAETLSDLKRNSDDAEKTEHHHLKNLDVNHGLGQEIKTAEVDAVPVKENEPSNLAEEGVPVPDEQTVDSRMSSEGDLHLDNDSRFNLEQNKQPENSMVESTVIDSSTQVSGESSATDSHQDTSIEEQKVLLDEGRDTPKSLADSYSLHADEVSPAEREKADTLEAFLNKKEVSVAEGGKSMDVTKPDEVKIVLDFIEAIHVAEKRQAEKDTYIFTEEKRKLKEKYEKELKDARARELMYAEEAAILEKELNKEKVKAVTAIKSLQEKAEQKLKEELHRKEEEAETEIKKAQELGKAEVAAAIAREKASQIEKIEEADMNIKALCMAFYARSEEARQTHSVHKLALGTLALEDALSNGLPIRAEVDALHKSLEGIDKDSLIELVLSSLPEEVLSYGTNTHMQLNQKFDSLKGTLRHFSLIPAGGGGLVTHAVASIASSIKMREDQSGHGIESLISKVDSYLIQGKFAEAAEALEGGVRGSEAEGVVVDWARQARNRAVVEQALCLLQSYATSITFS